MAKKAKERAREQKEALQALSAPKTSGLDTAKRQLRTAAKVAAVFLVVVWALAIGFWSGMDTPVPLYVGTVLTVSVAIAAGLIVRNLKKSENLGELLGGGDLSDDEREARIEKLKAKVEKGDAAAILATAQLQMSEAPKEALATLERVNLDKANKMIAIQVRIMRAMIHLNLGEVKAARALAEEVDLAKAPDPKSRANFSAIVAEAWARSGNPIEASELLDKYDPDEKEFEEVRMQLLRARAFASAHRNDINGMRRAVKQLVGISPQLPAMFVGQKLIHPLLEQEAKKQLAKAGFAPKQKIQFARR